MQAESRAFYWASDYLLTTSKRASLGEYVLTSVRDDVPNWGEAE